MKTIQMKILTTAKGLLCQLDKALIILSDVKLVFCDFIVSD